VSVSPLTPRERRTLFGLGLLYAVAVVVLRFRHVGDIAPEIALSDRLLRGEPLYTGIVFPQGSLWPPFASLALVPFALLARLSLDAAAAAWSVFGVACLVASIALTRRWGWTPALLALLVVAMPVQTNFEHRNVNTVLLALIVAGAVDLEDGRERRAGAWIGLAAALKAFPAIIFVYFALRRRWHGLIVGATVATVATLLPLMFYGPAGAVTAIGDWLSSGLDPGQWQLASRDQSLRALALRLGASPNVALGLIGIPFALVGVVALRPSAAGHVAGVGAVALAGVLAAPVAWVHYFVLAYPAWLAMMISRDSWGGWSVRRVAVILAAIATSGWLTIGQSPLRRALHEASAYTWGGLLLLVLLATMPARPPDAAPPPGA